MFTTILTVKSQNANLLSVPANNAALYPIHSETQMVSSIPDNKVVPCAKIVIAAMDPIQLFNIIVKGIYI